MARKSKTYYSLIVLALVIVLTGCELRREDGDVSDPGPVSELPTLAPLGSESTELVEEATVVPTVISADPAVAEPSLGEGEAASDPNEMVAPTSQPASIPAEPAAENTEVEQVAEATAPETFTPPVAESTAEETEEPIVVDATTEDLPDGGPIAANPPASQTTGDYDSYSYGDGTYIVQAGDTLFSIALRHGTSVQSLIYANGLRSDLIQVGQVLNITTDDGSYYPPAYEPSAPYGSYPPVAGGATHIVAQGDTLFRIALNYGTSVNAIVGANGIPYPYVIHPGQPLVIPAPGAYYPGPPPGPGRGYYQPGSDYGAPDSNSGYYPPPENSYNSYPEPNDGYYPPDNAYPGPGQPNPDYSTQMPDADYYYPPDNAYPGPGQPNPDYSTQMPGGDYYYPPDNAYPGPGQPNLDYSSQEPGGGYYQPDNSFPVPGAQAGTHTVAPGETLYSIAQRYGTSAEAIANANGLTDPNQIYVRQVLYLP
jgi:LysM repeat protein